MRNITILIALLCTAPACVTLTETENGAGVPDASSDFLDPKGRGCGPECGFTGPLDAGTDDRAAPAASAS